MCWPIPAAPPVTMTVRPDSLIRFLLAVKVGLLAFAQPTARSLRIFRFQRTSGRPHYKTPYTAVTNPGQPGGHGWVLTVVLNGRLSGGQVPAPGLGTRRVQAPRQERARHTFERVLDAGVELLAERGHEGLHDQRGLPARSGLTGRPLRAYRQQGHTRWPASTSAGSLSFGGPCAGGCPVAVLPVLTGFSTYCGRVLCQSINRAPQARRGQDLYHLRGHARDSADADRQGCDWIGRTVALTCEYTYR